MIGFVVYVARQRPRRAGAEVGVRDRAGAQPQALLRRRDPRGPAARPGPRHRASCCIAVTAVGLPLYWLNEPGRQSGAIENFDQTFVNRGAKLFAPTGDGGYNCAGCHGAEGVGGQAPPYTLTDADGEFVATVTWQAPALNTVLLRFSEEEVRQILIYGRPGTPMPAWGAEGGGPLTTQQIDELIAYLGSIQLTSEEAQAAGRGGAARRSSASARTTPIDYDDPAVGEALFNLGLESGVAGGAYSCARCHTKGASFRYGAVEPADADLERLRRLPRRLRRLRLRAHERRRPAPVPHHRRPRRVPHTRAPSTGCSTASAARAPAACPASATTRRRRPDDDEPDDGMFTADMIEAVAEYEASLGGETGGTGVADRADADDDDHHHDHRGALSDAAPPRRHRLGPADPRLPRRRSSASSC